MKTYLDSGHIEGQERKKNIPLYKSTRQLSSLHILELLAFLYDQLDHGKRVTIPSLREHLRSNDRVHEYCPIDLVPPCDIEESVIRKTMETCCHTTWTKVTRVGKQMGDMSPEKQEKRKWRLRVWWAQYCKAKIEEHEGRAIVFSADESYVHEHHHSEFSLVPTDKKKNPIADVNAPKRSGNRICIAGAICQWDHLITRDPEGNPIVDSDYRNAKGESVAQGGTFVELNNEYPSLPRAVFKHATNREPKQRQQKRKRQREFENVKKPQLQQYLEDNKALLEPIPQQEWPSKGWTDACRQFLREKRTQNPQLPIPPNEIVELEVMPDENVAATDPQLQTTGVQQQQLSDDENLAAVMSVIGVTDCTSSGVRGQEACAQQSIFMDWEKVRDSLLDMAHTTDKFFPALRAAGDYHKNFDAYTFFKWMVSVELTYPDFCQQLQKRKDDGTLHPPSAHDFWDKENNKPSRQLILFIDNAPYHQSLQVQLASKSKKDYTLYLRGLGVETIQFTRDGVQHNVEVPEQGKDWHKNYPRADELREVTMNIILERKPSLVQPPYDILMESKRNGVWGQGPKGWVTYKSAPYVANQVSVELKWADGKNYVANNIGDHSSARNVINMMRERWYSNKTKCASLFSHAEKDMLRAINEDHDENEGPMNGSTILDIQGLPDENTLALWMEKAGMNKPYDGTFYDTNDQLFADTEDCDGQEEY